MLLYVVPAPPRTTLSDIQIYTSPNPHTHTTKVAWDSNPRTAWLTTGLSSLFPVCEAGGELTIIYRSCTCTWRWRVTRCHQRATSPRNPWSMKCNNACPPLIEVAVLLLRLPSRLSNKVRTPCCNRQKTIQVLNRIHERLGLPRPVRDGLLCGLRDSSS